MKKVAVIYGGYSGEEVISKKSAALVLKHIDRSLYTPYPLLINADGWSVEWNDRSFPVDLNDFGFTCDGEVIRFDFAFVMIHGSPGEDGLLQGYFQMMNIPHTTADVLTMSLTFDKFTTNSFLREKGYNTARAIVLQDAKAVNAKKIASTLGFPCFVKPNRGGSSLATFKCRSEEEINNAVAEAFMVGKQVLVEEFIQGKEYTCGVIIKDGKSTPLPVTEIISENDFFDFEAKYLGQSKEVTPAEITPELTARIQKQSAEIFDLLRCKGMSRVDYLYRSGQLFVIEINTVPGFSEASIIPQQAEAMGISKKELISLVIAGSVDMD